MAKETFAKSKFGIDGKVISWEVLWLNGGKWYSETYKRGDAAYKLANRLAYNGINTVSLRALIADDSGLYWKTIAEC